MPKTHQMSGTVEYWTWQRMIARCHKPTHRDYPTYGAVGISVCDRWRAGFSAFFEDMGKKPSPKHSIDRFPNRDGNYEPGNCRWATPREQALNRCVTVLVTYRGETKSVSEWAETLGWNYHTLMGRLVRRNMDPERAIGEPLAKSRILTHEGKTLTITQWSIATGIPKEAIRSRLKNPNWTVKEALTVPNGEYMGCKARTKRQDD